jgi:hypothetical protein
MFHGGRDGVLGLCMVRVWVRVGCEDKHFLGQVVVVVVMLLMN